MTEAVGLDLGTTGIKVGLLDRGGRLGTIIRAPAPPVTGDGALRESDPLDYLERTRELLGRALEGLPGTTPVGIASQRSTFVLWEKSTGRPVTPLISWQDRRAAAWCESRQGSAPTVTAKTGLPLSPHYAGPKLAQILAENRALRDGVDKGITLFGTLESWVIWNLSSGKEHVTDISMAARTLLVDSAARSWSSRLLEFFSVPSACLPAIIRAGERHISLAGGGTVTATIADQPAALLAVSGAGDANALINLGTGGFILFPSKVRPGALPGYLTGPVGGRDRDLVALEGTINGIGPALAGAGESLPFPEEDPAADLFCLPETSGLGSPFWKPDIPQSFSRDRETLTAEDHGRAIREGIIFRVRQIVEDIEAVLGKRRLFLAGGIAGDRHLTAALAACLWRTLHRLTEKESTLLGAALMARGLPGGDADSEAISPDPARGGYLHTKYRRWRQWAASMTMPPADHPR